MTRRGAKWSLDRAALERLLTALDPDRKRAAERYELVRRRLIRFFEGRRCHPAEELADQTIDRVARKVVEGTEIRAADPFAYFCAVAWRVLKEGAARRSRERAAVEHSLAKLPRGPSPETAGRLRCLDRCLQCLSPESRRLVLEFYRGERGARILRRKRLAVQLGVTVNALRIRIHRLRADLERCIRRCLAGQPPKLRRDETR